LLEHDLYPEKKRRTLRYAVFTLPAHRAGGGNGCKIYLPDTALMRQFGLHLTRHSTSINANQAEGKSSA
jgi:hypothetical protein